MPGVGGGFPLAPWHMWGSSVTLTSDADTAGGSTVASGQLLRINYKRPETWSFFFGGKIVSAVTPAIVDLVVLIDVIAGVGRSIFDSKQPGNVTLIPGFVRFVWRISSPSVFGGQKYTTVGSGPALDDTAGFGVFPAIEWLPAQDIQVQVRAAVTGSPGSSATVEVTGWMAPRTHVRPEWFSDEGEQFRGKETGGT